MNGVLTTKRPAPKTRQKLLDAAVDLILRQGFAATTVDEICEEAELTKGSFFHYFKNKDQLGEMALEHFCATRQCGMAEAAFNKIKDPLERLHGFLDFLEERARSREMIQGCLIGDLVQEVARTHPKIRRKCDTAFGHFIGGLNRMLSEAKARYKPKVDFDSESVATLILSLMQGSMILAKARQDTKPIIENLEHLRAYIDGLFGRPGGKLGSLK